MITRSNCAAASARLWPHCKPNCPSRLARYVTADGVSWRCHMRDVIPRMRPWRLLQATLPRWLRVDGRAICPHWLSQRLVDRYTNRYSSIGEPILRAVSTFFAQLVNISVADVNATCYHLIPCVCTAPDDALGACRGPWTRPQGGCDGRISKLCATSAAARPFP